MFDNLIIDEYITRLYYTKNNSQFYGINWKNGLSCWIVNGNYQSHKSF